VTTDAGQLSESQISGRPVRGHAAQAVRTRMFRPGFEGRVVVDDVHLEIAPGESIVLLGRSGSVKFTLFREFAEP
jgi:ABC-type Fe3+/spermidine/putrescine transport system ATPase subunit